MAGEWKSASLREVCKEIYRYPSFYGMEKHAHGVPVVRGEHLLPNGTISTDWADYWFVSEEYARRFPKTRLALYDLVMSVRGSIGTVARVGPAHVGAQISPNLIRLSPDPEQVEPAFFYYALKGSAAGDFITSTSSSSAVPAIRAFDIKLAEIPRPPVPEQRAIAHIIGTLDDKIELNRRMNETLETMAQAIFKSWFVDFAPVRAKFEGHDAGLPKPIADLFPDSFVDSEMGEIPKGWEVKSLGDHMVNFDSKRVPVSSDERAKRKGTYPYHGAAGVMDYVDDYLFDGIYALVGEDGSVVQESGLAVTQYVWGKIWVNNHAHVLQGRGMVSTEQLYLYFHFEPVAPYVTGAVQPKLSQGRMNSMPFLFAGDNVCRAFAELVSPYFACLRANTDENRTLASLRDALLPKLISGELRVKDAERFVEGAL